MASNLLLVDESPLIHRVVELTFEGHDISVYSADDAEEAMALVRSLKPDIIIASTHIKRGNGLEFCRELQGEPDLSHIPVLLLAGAKENLSEEEAQKAGAIGVLIKPFDPESLLSEVGLALSWNTSTDGEETSAADETSPPDAPSGTLEEEINELESISPDEIDENKLDNEIDLEALDVFPETPPESSGIPDEQDDKDSPLPELSGEEALLEAAEDLIGETEAQIAPGGTEEESPGQTVSDAPATGKDMSAETPSVPQDESSSQEEEDLFEDSDLEDLFEEYSSDAESGPVEPASSQAEQQAEITAGSSAENEPSSPLEADAANPSPKTGEGETIESQPGGELEGLSEGELDDFDEADLKAAEDDLASLQAELSADLEEIGGSDFTEEKIRTTEEELASLEADLALEGGDNPDPKNQESSPDALAESLEGLNLGQDSAEFEIPTPEEESTGSGLADEISPGDDIPEVIFPDEEDDLREKLGEGPGPDPPHESPEIYALSPENEPQEEEKEEEEPGEPEDNLAAMMQEGEIGPEIEVSLETPGVEESPEADVSLEDESFSPDALLEAELTAPLRGEADSGKEEKEEPPEPDPPKDSGKEEQTLEKLLEKSLEKTIESIVPAILRRIESITVEKLPDMVEKIVLREIEKIKRGE